MQSNQPGSAPQTAAQLFELYQNHLLELGKKADLAMTQSALVRSTIPGWSKVFPQGAKATSAEVRAALSFLQTLSSEQFVNEALTVQRQVFEQLEDTPSNERKYRHYLKRFIDWIGEQDWSDEIWEPDENSIEQEVYQFSRPEGALSAYRFRSRTQRKKEKYTLSVGEIRPELQRELDAFAQYMKNKLHLRPASYERVIRHMRQILGWFHRFQQVPLDQLNLETIVPVVRLKLRLRDFKTEKGFPDIQAHAIAKVLVQEEAEETAKQTLKSIEEYLEFCGTSPYTKTIVLTSLLDLAKFLYREETDAERSNDFEDIPMIVQLRKLRREWVKQSKTSPEAIPYEQKSVIWPRALEVLQQLQKEADLDVYWVKNPRKEGFLTRPRSERAIAKSVQKLLALAFLTLVPPDRSRTLYELEIGRTLVKGIYIANTFTPFERMKNPQEAKWYLHLTAPDYKTGKAYREFWGGLPDISLDRGKTFYYYIELWLLKYRQVFQPTHNYFFTGVDGVTKGKPIAKNTIKDMIRESFYNFTGVPVTPKELRRMYVTYLKEKGASEAELEAAAVWMHHSRKMQAEVYDQQVQQNKIAPIYDFNQAVVQQVFGHEG